MRRLRTRFVVAAMIAVSVVLFALVGTMNVVNYLGVCESADERLTLISQGGLSIPDESSSSSPEGVAKGVAAGESSPAGDGRDKEPKHEMSPEAPFEVRWFSVTFPSDGADAQVDLDRIASVTRAEAQAMAEAVASLPAERGFYGACRYLRVEGDQGAEVYFLDSSRDLDSFESFLASSAAVSALGWLLVFVLVVIFSGRATRPVVESYEKQKRFVTDASHEIKTPLAVIAAANDVIEMEHGESEWTSSIREQVDRLSALTERLVLLARMDEQDRPSARERVDLSSQADRLIESFEALAASRGKSLRAEIDRSCECEGDRAALAQAMELLLDNATRYAPRDSAIAVSLARHGKMLRFSVENDLAAPLTCDPERLFDRFYREDASRSSETGGTGVGLSVVRAVARAHGGRASAHVEGSCIVFVLEVPAAPSRSNG